VCSASSLRREEDLINIYKNKPILINSSLPGLKPRTRHGLLRLQKLTRDIEEPSFEPITLHMGGLVISGVVYYSIYHSPALSNLVIHFFLFDHKMVLSQVALGVIGSKKGSLSTSNSLHLGVIEVKRGTFYSNSFSRN
jgi:hypothetical protein